MKSRIWKSGGSKQRIFSPGSKRLSLAGLITAAMLGGGVASAADVTYGDVKLILSGRCVVCHAGPAAPLGLRLDSLEGLLKGSQNGPVVKAGNPEGSELIRRLKGLSQPRMPMTGPPYLGDEDIALLEQWIAGGLVAGAPADRSKARVDQDVDSPQQIIPARPAAGEPVTYAHVAPIFARRCAKCHTDQGLMGAAPEGFRLTSYASTLSAADRVRVVPGQPEASELVRRLRGQALPRMPFDGPPYLIEEEIHLIEQWIAQGASNSEGKPAAVPAGARVRLHGILSGKWKLDDLPLTVTDGTRIDKAPKVGDYVRVRGRLSRDGSVIAERIRRR